MKRVLISLSLALLLFLPAGTTMGQDSFLSAPCTGCSSCKTSDNNRNKRSSLDYLFSSVERGRDSIGLAREQTAFFKTTEAGADFARLGSRPSYTRDARCSESEPFSEAQTQPAGDAQELAKQLSNPVASLISLPFQSNFDFGMGAGSGWRYTLNIQPVIPVSLSPKWNLISRTIVPIIHQHNVANLGTQSGLGDITQSFFLSPTDSKRFIWGAGPVLLIPTATDELLGTEKFGIGPTVLILKQREAWTYGILANHLWSVAGDDSRASVNSTFLQPFLAYNTRDAWTFGLNTESSYDWTGNHWSTPIHVTVSKLVRLGKQPVSFGGALRCWATSPAGGPEGCGIRIIVTPLFPK